MVRFMASTPRLDFRVSRGSRSTISPPIPRAYEWASRYVPTPTRPLLDMAQGVPGIPPPESLRAALGKAGANQASFGYCPWSGEEELREALVREMKLVYGEGTYVKAEDVALTAGCNMAFMAVAMSIVDSGDEVILPMPWYFNHQMSLNLLGVEAIPLPTLSENGFTPSVERCRELITLKTRAIALVTPNNPTGATYSPKLISSFFDLAHEYKLALIIDETYRDFITTSTPPHNLFSSPLTPWRSTFIHLFSFSKSYCLPGHRLGAIVASPELLTTSVRKVLDSMQICPPRPIQQALGPLLPSLRGFVRETALALESRHILFKDHLPEKWRIGAQGGYFAFVRHPFVRVCAVDVCQRLAEEVGVVTLPARFFSDARERESGAEGEKEEPVEEEERWIRFSVANIPDEKVLQVCERLSESEKVFGWKM